MHPLPIPTINQFMANFPHQSEENRKQKISEILTKIDESSDLSAKNFVLLMKKYFSDDLTIQWLADSEMFLLYTNNGTDEFTSFDNCDITLANLSDFFPRQILMSKPVTPTIRTVFKTLLIEDFWGKPYHDNSSLNFIFDLFDRMEPFVKSHLYKFVMDSIQSTYPNNYFDIGQFMHVKKSKYNDFIYGIIVNQFVELAELDLLDKSIGQSQKDELLDLMNRESIRALVFFILILHYKVNNPVIPIIGLIYNNFGKVSSFYVEIVSKYKINLDIALKDILCNDDPLLLESLLNSMDNEPSCISLHMGFGFISYSKHSLKLNLNMVEKYMEYLKKHNLASEQMIINTVDYVQLVNLIEYTSFLVKKTYIDEFTICQELLENFNALLLKKNRQMETDDINEISKLINHYGKILIDKFIDLVSLPIIKKWFGQSTTYGINLLTVDIFSELLERKLTVNIEPNPNSEPIPNLEIQQIQIPLPAELIEYYKNVVSFICSDDYYDKQKFKPVVKWFWMKKREIFTPEFVANVSKRMDLNDEEYRDIFV